MPVEQVALVAVMASAVVLGTPALIWVLVKLKI